MVQGGLSESQHLLLLRSKFYLLKACIHNVQPGSAFLFYVRGGRIHLFSFSLFSFSCSDFPSSEDIAVAAVGEVVPPHPDRVMVLIRDPLRGTLLQRGEL